MRQDLDKFAQDLQESILEDARRTYSEKVIENFMQPENVGTIKDADGLAEVKGACGDSMEIWLKVDNDKITDIRFLTHGCGPTIACGSMATQLAKGKSIREAMKISPNDVIEGLDGLPQDNLHCAILAVNTLHSAIGKCLLCKEKAV